MTLAMLALAAGFGFALARITGLPVASIILAYSPGGFTEMTLVALALELDVAFVATHHVVRIIMVVAAIPICYRLFGPRSS